MASFKGAPWHPFQGLIGPIYNEIPLYNFYKTCNGTNRLKTPIFHYNQLYLRLKSKQSIDMAGPCSILMDFDYTKAKLCKIPSFSWYFCSEKTLLCSEKTLLCSEKTSLCSSKTPLCSEKTPLCSSRTPLCSSETNMYEK